MRLTKSNKLWMLFGLSFLIIVLIGFFDSQLIKVFFDINSQDYWRIYEEHTMRTVWYFGMAIFATLGITWYIVYRDISESLGLALSGIIMLSTGLEDVMYFVWSSQTMSSCMIYLNNIIFINFTSFKLLGETCVSSTGLYLNAFIGILFAILVFKIMEKVN
jgi:hypothetical protein